MQSKLLKLFLIMHCFIGSSYGMEDSVVISLDKLPNGDVSYSIENIDASEYTVFKAVQRIDDIIDEIVKEFSECGIFLEKSEKKLKIEPFCQTKRGIFIMTGKNNYPRLLVTPWGTKELCSEFYIDRQLGCEAFMQSFLKRLTTTFYSINTQLAKKNEVYELREGLDLRAIIMGEERVNFKNCFNTISSEELENKKGKNTFIISDSIGGVGYKVHAVENHQLPDPQLLEFPHYRNYKTVKTIWNILMVRYTKEKEMSKDNIAS